MFKAEERKHLSSLYEAMLMSEAWKDLERYANGEMAMSIQRSDSRSAADISLGEVCEERGIRKGIKKIMEYAKNRMEGV